MRRPCRTLCRRFAAPRRRLSRLLLAAATIATLGVPRVALGASSTLYTISGRGFGHGIGMSQYGAEGYARRGWSYRSILAHYYTGTTLGTASNMTLRVLLRDGASLITVTSSRRFSLYDERRRRRTYLAAGNVLVITPRSGAFRVTNLTTGRRVGYYVGPLRIMPGSAFVRMLSTNANGRGRLSYRGWLRLLMRSSRLRVVNYVPLESYLRGVVPKEMPASWNANALRAQSVAARSYAIANRRTSGDFDLYATTASQYYGAVPAERSATTRAITATKGIVLRYRGGIIPAYFHSSSGGMTEDNENVWSGSALAWARGVSDPYDTISPYHAWPENPIRLTPATLDARLGSLVKGRLWAAIVTGRGTSPRATRLKIGGSGGARYVSGSTVRSRLGLRSTWFLVRAVSIATTATIVQYGRPIVFRGQVTPAPSSAIAFKTRPLANRRWSSVSLKTAASGAYYKVMTASAGAYHRAAWGPAASPARLVRVRGVVSLVASSYDVRVGQRVRLAGGVSPNHAGKRVSVKVYSSTGWRAYSAPVLSSSSRYSTYFTPRRRGRFYFCTLLPSDADHVGNVSVVRTIVAR